MSELLLKTRQQQSLPILSSVPASSTVTQKGSIYVPTDFMNQELLHKINKIDQLKSVLPSVPQCISLKKESTTSMAGACPKCGGKDRFVYKTDSHKSWCRNCVPENKPMDIINFHCWLYNKTVKELIKEHLPPETDNNPDFNSKWLRIVNKNTDTSPCHQLCRKRHLTDDVTESLIKQGKINSCDYMDKKAVAFPFTDMAGNVIFIQYLTADESKFPHIESKKSFNKGSHISQDGFFQCGKSIHEDSKGIILVEGVINAISGSQVLPDYTWLATGSATSTQKKVHNRPPAKLMVTADHKRVLLFL